MKIGDFVKIKPDTELYGKYEAIGKVIKITRNNDFDINVEFTKLGEDDFFKEEELVKVSKLKWLCENGRT